MTFTEYVFVKGLSNILLRLSWKIPSYKKQKKEVILFKRFKEMSEAVCSVCLCVQHHAAQTSKNFLFLVLEHRIIIE